MALIWKTAFQSAALFIITALTVVMAVSTTVSAETQTKSLKPVVELFTSQGCSSCPPADAFLGILSKKNNVIALTYAVDYWDYLGWKDTFAQAKFTKRQKTYAYMAGTRTIYTPQMVVGGLDAVIGNRAMEVADTLRAHLMADPSGVTLSVRVEGDEVLLSGQSSRAFAAPAQVSLIVFAPETEVKIGRGENAGRKIAYSNVVQDWQVVGAWDGTGPLSVTMPAPAEGGLVALVQADGQGPVLASSLLRR